MSLKIALLSLIAVLPLAAAAQTQHATGSPHVATSKATVEASKSLTPAERLLKPYLSTRLAVATADKSVRPETARPAFATPPGQPNFGGFLSPAFYPARLASTCVTEPVNCGVSIELTADFDHDGKPDIAALQNNGTLNVLLNNGTGGLATPVSYINPNYSTSVVDLGFAVDVNNDGYADIVELDDANDGGNNSVIIFLNQKDGTFGPAQTITLNSDNGLVSSLALGDVNADGNIDIVAATATVNSRTSTSLTVQTYMGSGHGTFTLLGTTATPTVDLPAQSQIPTLNGITLGDLNKDHKLDLAIDLEERTGQLTGNLVVTLALGNGDGTFGPLNVNNPVSIPITGSPNNQGLIFETTGVQIVDLNNDSNPDIAVDGGGVLSVALGNGSLSFSPPVQTANYGNSFQVLYADVTGDGIPDLIQESGELNIWTGKGDGTFILPFNGNSYASDSGATQLLALADFNGDGTLDIAHLDPSFSGISIFNGLGKGSYNGAPMLSSTTDAYPNPAGLTLGTVGDLKGNGFTDAVFVDSSGTANDVVSGISDGKGNFTYVVALPASAVTNLAYIQPISADFNGDGKQDLVFAGIDSSLSVALSKGDGTFATPIPVTLPALNCEVTYSAAGDLNSDGITDLVIPYPGDFSCGGSGSEPSGYFIALGKGDGTFATPVFTASGAELYSAVIADMNLDGIPDLILDDAPFHAGGSFAVNLLPGNGDGTFATGNTVSSNYLVSQVIAGDINQDGKSDLILLSEGEQTATNPYDTAGILLLAGNGDGTFSDTNQIGTGNFFLNGLLADVNNDGIPDLVTALYGTIGQTNTYFGLSTMLGLGHGQFGAPINTVMPIPALLPLAGNFLADNSTDIIVTTTYGTALFLGQGGTTISLSLSASSIPFGQAETITATLSPSLSSQPAPTGSIAFYDGTTLLGTSPISGGSAVFASSALAVGSHSITAVYAGDSNFNPNSTAAATLAVTTVAPAFTLAATPGTISVSIGQQATATLTLTSNATFSGTVNLACTGLPANASCAVNPASVTLSGASSLNATLIIGTTTSKASTTAANSRGSLLPLSGLGGLSLAGLLCCFGRRRRLPSIVGSVIGVFLLVAMAQGLSGCGSSSSPVKTAPKGTYTVTVTATPTTSSAAAQTATVSITVQ
jgi:hypothetical protein